MTHPPSTNDDDSGGSSRPATIVPFPALDEERARRLKVEVDRLARLSPTEWMFYVASAGYAEKYGVDGATLKRMVEAVIKAAEKKQRDEQTEQRRIEARAEKQRVADQRRVDKQADKKARERAKEFAALLKLPTAVHEARLAALAKRLDEDSDALRDEFATFTAVEDKVGDSSAAEPWPEPVNAKALLDAILGQIRRYIVIHDDSAAIMYALSVLFAWCHDEVATFSPILVVHGADADTAKTTLCHILGRLTPRSHMVVKPTGPALYRLVDSHHPTLIIDNADKLLRRDRDLADIINSSWTRGVRIPRVVEGNIYEFDPFCFKVINGIDLLPHLDPATRTRCIVTELLPKLPGENVIDFKHAAVDEQFLVLRRQAMRWCADNVKAIAGAAPPMPEGFNNRLEANYTVLFAIADLAGGEWPKQARAAARKLSFEYNVPSLGRRLLAVFHDLFGRYGKLLTSKQMERALPVYDDEWANYQNRGRGINRWEIANLLRPFKIRPHVIHPRGHPADRGYEIAQFEVAFRHYLGKGLPRGRTVVRKRRKKPRK
jgi:hypothetical protein